MAAFFSSGLGIGQEEGKDSPIRLLLRTLITVNWAVIWTGFNIALRHLSLIDLYYNQKTFISL